MKNPFNLAVLAGVLLGCQTTTTAELGIRYGMSKQDVITRISATDKVIGTDGDTVTTEGIFQPTHQLSRKTFVFQDGKLVTVNYKIL